MALVSYNPSAGIDDSARTVSLSKARGSFSFRGGVGKDGSKCDILIDPKTKKLGFRFNDTIGYAVQQKSKIYFVKCIKIFSDHEWLKDGVMSLKFDKSLKAWVIG